MTALAIDMEHDQLRYAGFWPRLGSLLLDIVIMMPLAIIAYIGQNHYRLFDVYELLPLVLFGLWFNVYLVGRFGGTPGKLILGMRIVKVSGEAASYGAAFIRNFPLFILDAVWRIGFALALLQMTDAAYFALDWHHRNVALAKMVPPWSHWVQVGMSVWFWSEVVVLLTNKKRRAIHDFIAGTVVVKRA